MSDLEKKLQQELAFYTNLLKKHETVSQESKKLQLSAKQSHPSHWKQMHLPTYKAMKPSSHLTYSPKSLLQSSKTYAQNKRTVLCSENETKKSSQNVRQSVNPIPFKRTVVNSVQNPKLASLKRSVIIPKSTEKLIESKSLLGEIEYFTNLLKLSKEKNDKKLNIIPTENNAGNKCVIGGKNWDTEYPKNNGQVNHKIFHVGKVRRDNSTVQGVNKVYPALVSQKTSINGCIPSNPSEKCVPSEKQCKILTKNNVTKPVIEDKICDSECLPKNRQHQENFKIFHCGKVQSNKSTFQNINKLENPTLVSHQTSLSGFIPLNPPEKCVPSESKGLLKEIELLTDLLKNSNEDNCKKIDTLDSKRKLDKPILNDKIIASRGSKDNFELPKKSKIFHNNQIKNERVIGEENMMSISNDSKAKVQSAKQISFFPDKSIFKNETSDVLNKFIFNSHSSTKNVLNHNQMKKPNNSHLSRNSSKFSKISTPRKQLKIGKNSSVYKLVNEQRQALNKKVGKDTSKYKFISKQSSFLPRLNSPSNLMKKSIVTKSSRKNEVFYLKSNKTNSNPLVKQALKSKFVYSKNSPSNQKTKKVSLKYKVVNQSNSTNTSQILKFQNSTSEELDISDPLIKLLDNSDVDKLEQHLLAVSTSLTATPKHSDTKHQSADIDRKNINQSGKKRSPKCKIITSKYKVINKNVTNKFNSKCSIKKSPKKCKVLSSKYKVVNRNLKSTPKSLLKDRDLRNPAKKVSRKVILTKFSIVNKHSSVNAVSSLPKTSPVLVKRLYKSKNTIINSNSNPINNRAKLIKSKYFGINKRSFSAQNQLYPKLSNNLQKFRGSGRLQQKSTWHQKTMLISKGNRFYKKNEYSSSMQYRKNNSVVFKQTRNKAYVHSPILLLRGTRYSKSSSGKTLKRLPTKGETWTSKTPKKAFARKPYIRTSNNMMKVINSTTSVHIASRVLNKSINRVITASSKKSLTKKNSYCMFYNRFGRCNRGVKCTYIHDPSKIAVCTRFLRGTCKTEGCPFSHEVAPGKMAICSFYLMGACEKDNCPYRHETLSPDAELCKAFVQGYCPKGKECKKAHILICPKFILGECEKGSSCAYPHPPQRAKKNVQKETVVNEDIAETVEKDDNVLLEKVARYFLPLQGSSNSESVLEKNDGIPFFVPKPRKLEEQPTFIPLFDMATTSKTSD